MWIIGAEITSMALDEVVLQHGTDWLTAEVVIRNLGYVQLTMAELKLTDTSGTVLEQNGIKGNDGYYEYRNLWIEPGQGYVQTIQFKPNPNWAVGSQTLHLILRHGDEVDEGTVQPFSLQAEGEAADDEYEIVFDTEILTLTGNQVVLGDEHVAQLQISNDSIVPYSKCILLQKSGKRGKHPPKNRPGFIPVLR